MRFTLQDTARIAVDVEIAGLHPQYGNLFYLSEAQAFSDIYGSLHNTFTTRGTLQLFSSAMVETYGQFTLFLHRVKSPTSAYVDQLYGDIDGTKTWNTYRSVTVQSSEHLVGILSLKWYASMYRSSPGSESMSVNYTSPGTVILKSTGISYNSMSYVGLFYAVSNTPPPVTANGCQYGCSSCTSYAVCTICDTRDHRIAAPDANNQCPCRPGYYENASGTCTSCPAAKSCEACKLSSGTVVCTACRCKNNRELASGSCVCKAGYQESPTNPGATCIKI